MIENTKAQETSIRKEQYIADINRTVDFILDGHTIEEAAEKEQITKGGIKKRINAFQDMNPEKYQKVIKVLTDIKNEQERVEREQLTQNILKLFQKGHTVTEIRLLLGKGYDLAKEIYAALNDPNSPYYDPKTYANIQKGKDEKKLKYRDDFNLESSLKPENSVFAQFSENKRKEIILMALTFRLSYKTLAAMFGTTIEDIVVYLEGISATKHAMQFLNIETINESFRLEIKAYQSAKKYWDERNHLINAIKEIQKNSNIKVNESTEDAISTLKTELKELRKQIDDSIVIGTKNKRINELTDEEKNALARYRLKYASTIRQCVDMLYFDRYSMQKLEKELSKLDPIFKEKIDRLNSYWYNEREEYYDNDILEEQTSQFGRGGGSR